MAFQLGRGQNCFAVVMQKSRGGLHRSGSLRKYRISGLERELQTQLNLSRVTCCEKLSELIVAAAAYQRRNAAEHRIGRQPVRNCLDHVVKDRLVKDIEKLHP